MNENDIPRKRVDSLDDIKDRCTLIGRHWIWRGGVMAKSQTPVVSFRSSRLAARKVAWVLAGKPLAEGFVVFGTCEYSLCVRPTCSRAGDRGDSVRNTGRLGRFSTEKRRLAAIRNTMHKRKLTPDVAAQILADPRTQSVLAAEYGVSKYVVGRIKRRQSYTDAPMRGDVFSMAQSGLFTRLVSANDGDRRAA